MRDGIDCASKITADVAKKLAAAGQAFAARYLVPDKYSKWLSPAEAQVISDAGLDILSVYETTASRANDGYAAGVNDGKIAYECAKNVKQPGGAIYFAVDFDVTTAAQMDNIEQYLKGAAVGLLGTPYAVGVYGEFSVIEEMNKRKAAKYFWQTYAWSGGKKSAVANVYQYKNGQTLAGIGVDFNNDFGGSGMWNLRPAGPTKKTPFDDVPAGQWFESSVKAANDAGIMSGLSATTFGVGQPLKREEAAAIVAKILNLMGK